MAILQLIRIKNLIIIALTLMLIRYAVIHPIYVADGTQSAMSEIWFWLFVLHTVMIAAAGNVINDYFDTHIDEINKPEKVIVGKTVTRKMAMMLHQGITAFATLIALANAYKAKSIPIAFLLLCIPGLLWFYSSVYKRQFLVGNLIIALLCALVPLTLALIENRLLYLREGDAVAQAAILKSAFVVSAIFAAFAFLTTLIREIIKDVEDEEGDRELECSTVPILLGITWTKVVVIALSAFTIATIAMVYYNHLAVYNDALSYYYLLFMVVIPLIMVIAFTLMAKQLSDYGRISALLKYIMTSGIFYAIVFYLLLARTFAIPFFGLMVQ